VILRVDLAHMNRFEFDSRIIYLIQAR